MPAVLVYRDSLFAPSESFIQRMYRGFTTLEPRFVGTRIDRRAREPLPAADLIGASTLSKVLFKQLGRVPEATVRAAKDADVRIVHAQFGLGGALALPLARALNVPLAVTFHGGDATKKTHYRQRLFGRSVYQRRMNVLNEEAVCILCVSDFIRGVLIERGFDPRKLVTHHLGIDAPSNGGPRPSPAATTLLAVGRLVEKKGFDVAIEAMRGLQPLGDNLKLDIVGDGPLLGALKRRAEGLPVTFRGWLDPDGVSRAMRHAYALLAPSRRAESGDSEGLPTVVLEAQMRDLPVIASRHAGIPEAVIDGETGLLCDENDPAGLAAAIATLRGAPDLWYRLQSEGAAHARAGFDAKTQSQRLERLLVGCLK